jgi:hypothetical protein
MAQTPQFQNSNTQPLNVLAQQQPSQIPTAPEPDLSDISDSLTPAAASQFPLKRKLTRIVAIFIILALSIALYFTWHSSSTPSNTSPVITQQNFSGTSTNSNVNTGNSLTTNGDIQVYVVGAVKHPGVYILPAGSRVYSTGAGKPPSFQRGMRVPFLVRGMGRGISIVPAEEKNARRDTEKGKAAHERC